MFQSQSYATHAVIQLGTSIKHKHVGLVEWNPRGEGGVTGLHQKQRFTMTQVQETPSTRHRQTYLFWKQFCKSLYISERNSWVLWSKLVYFVSWSTFIPTDGVNAQGLQNNVCFQPRKGTICSHVLNLYILIPPANKTEYIIWFKQNPTEYILLGQHLKNNWN